MALLAACAGGPCASHHTRTESDQNDSDRRVAVRMELASGYFSRGQYATALDEIKQALQIRPDLREALNLRSLVYAAMGENEIAEEGFRRALSLDARDADTAHNYGWFLCQTGREQRSIAYFMAAAKNPLYTTPTRPFTNAGICSLALKDDKAAEDYLSTALRLSPTNTQALYWLADIAYRKGRLQEARQLTTDIEKMMEPTAEVLWLALRIERKLGNREAEARYSSQLRRRFAGSPEQRLLLQGQYD